jgi:radical SAM superfamily enzyme YgiQ (UPF0313 family)
MRKRIVDILFVKPGNPKLVYGELSDFELTAIEPPFWASLLAGYLRQRDYQVAIIDAEAEALDHAATATSVETIRPTLCVICVSGSNPSASTMNMAGAGALARQIKQFLPDIPLMFHGLHPSALPEQTLKTESIDFVCQGEGFETIAGLMEALKGGGDLGTIPGLWYRKRKAERKPDPPKVYADLSRLAAPAWDLLPMEKYRAHNWHCFDDLTLRQPYGVLYTSLGCPYNCDFCCINAMFGKPRLRFRPPEDILRDIDLLVTRYGVRNIKVMDELFAISEQRVEAVCGPIIERGYDLNMWAYARVNTVTRKMLTTMKAAGINWVAYGFESGNRQVLKDSNKRYAADQVSEVVRMTYDEGLNIGANYIFGLPGDTFGSMQDTLELSFRINAEWANFYTAMAYPGSKLYARALRDGLALPTTWDGYSQYAYDSQPLPTDTLSSGEILSFRDYAFHAYFENPRYLDKLARKFGAITAEHVKEMTKHRLQRGRTQFNLGCE